MRPECSLVCEPLLCTDTKVIIVVSTRKMSKQNPSRSSEANQTLLQDDEDEILREEPTQPSPGNDSLPNMLTSLNDNIVDVMKSFSTLSETLASFTAAQGKKRDSRQPSNPVAKRRKLSLSTSSQLSDSDELAHEFEQEEKTTSPIAKNSRTLSTSDGRQNSQILSSMTEWENTSDLRTATKCLYPELTAKYGEDFSVKEGALIYALPRYRKSSLKFAQFWHNLLIS